MSDPSSALAYPPATWRLIVDAEASGAAQMAIDEAMLHSLLEGASPPTLRFYAWSPPCLSLGRNQPLAEVDGPACRAAGVDVVRRPTGGRAILHTDELTYSVVLLQSDPRATGDIVTCYRTLSEGLLAGLRSLGVAVEQAAVRRRPQAGLTAVCFDTPADYEITAGERKLVGSAQWRAKGALLQHGSLPLHGDITRIVDYLALSAAERQSLRRTLEGRAMTLCQALGRLVPFSEVARALALGFARTLHLDLIPGTLTDRERALASELLRTRYAAGDWTARA